jgi:phosphate starvation-inducible PhoH-like protein
MKETNRERKNPIKYLIDLNDEQKLAKQLIYENQIVIITGRAGSGKSLVGAITALDFLNKKMIDKILVTRSAIEVGKSLGYLPGSLDEKFNPYMEALIENLYKCWDKSKVDELVTKKLIDALPVQFIRGKTVDDILIVEEAQNLTKQEMLALLTRLGKTGKIIINGDNEQQDTKESLTGLSYAIELSKKISEIKWIKLKENHRSDLVGKILDLEYGK